MDTMQVPTNDGRCLSVPRVGGRSSISLINEAIQDKLDVNRFLATSNSINIADVGCSVGFVAVKNIVESIRRKGLDEKRADIQFQVFFNDHLFNRFDSLFKSLPSDLPFFTAGVPGSIHGRLFPRGALHFVHSKYAIHWLSKIPHELTDKKSPAFNKGKIFYTNSSSEVVEAYAAQFTRDMEAFLSARAEELVSGGLMALLVPCFEFKKYPLLEVVNLLGDCLGEMVDAGWVSEDKVDCFNIPRYNATPEEIKDIIDKNDRFRLEKMERFGPPFLANKTPNINMFMVYLQTSWEGLIKQHFGSEIIDDLFSLLRKKIVTSSVLAEANMSTVSECFILLQRKAT